MCNSTFSYDALYSEQSVFSIEASWAAVGLIRKHVGCELPCHVTSLIVTWIKMDFTFLAETDSFMKLLFMIFVPFQYYEVRVIKTLFHFSQSFLPSVFFPFLIFCKAFPVQFTSSYKSVCGSYKLRTHHNHPVLVAAVICMFPHHRVLRVV